MKEKKIYTETDWMGEHKITEQPNGIKVRLLRKPSEEYKKKLDERNKKDKERMRAEKLNLEQKKINQNNLKRSMRP